MTIGEKLRELREEKELTQAELSSKTLIHKNSISAWERDVCEPSVFNCIVLADYFGITLDELCCRNNNGKK